MIYVDKLYIILLNYNGYEDTVDCINSINVSEKNLDYEIVVVDNCSTDDSYSKLQKVENIKLIKNSSNSGFAAGNNLGINYALNNHAKYVLLLNNDTIDTLDSIYKLKQKMDSDVDVGVLGCRVMYNDNKELINYYGGSIDWFKGTAIMGNYKKKYVSIEDNYFYCEYITGCCMLIRTSILEKTGLLPEEYFMYYEDVDFCVRVKECGYKLAVYGDSYIYHKTSSSSGGEGSPFAIEWNTKNRLVFMKKYNFKFKSYLFFYVTRFLIGIKYIIKGQKEQLKAMRRGIRNYKKEKKNGK